MQYEIIHGYYRFTSSIHSDWINSGVEYIKLVELSVNAPYQVFELIPNSEIPDSEETIYNIHSDDITELFEDMEKVKFIVHEIYLEEDED